jgi:hypothetical protein
MAVGNIWPLISMPGIFGSMVGVGVAGGVAAEVPRQAETNSASPTKRVKSLMRFMYGCVSFNVDEIRS